jgi:opacity protein-like surface antigen
MKYRFVALLAACIALSGMSIAYAADVTGKWIAQVPGRNGQTRDVTITLKAEGEKLTGTVSGRQGDTAISDGQIKGDELSFTVTQNFQGNEVKVNYKGKVSGDEIKFTRTFGGGDRPPVEFTAKRAK